jgi:hypothetical protein
MSVRHQVPTIASNVELQIASFWNFGISVLHLGYSSHIRRATCCAKKESRRENGKGRGKGLLFIFRAAIVPAASETALNPNFKRRISL